MFNDLESHKIITKTLSCYFHYGTQDEPDSYFSFYYYFQYLLQKRY